MHKCRTCQDDKVETRLIHKYHAELLGGPFPVFLVDSVSERACLTCGSRVGKLVPNVEGIAHVEALIRVSAAARALQKLKGRPCSG